MFDLHTIHVGALLLDLHIPESNSLKTKRRTLLRLKDTLKNKFNVSVAELSELDKWQRAVVGVVMISNDKTFIDQALQSALNLAGTMHEVRVVESRIEFL